MIGVIRRRIPDCRRRVRIVERLHVVAAVLVDLVVVCRKLVLRADLPRQADERALDELIVDPLAAIGKLRLRDEVVHRVIPRRRVEPQRVPHDRPAFAGREIHDPVGGVPEREARHRRHEIGMPRLEPIREVVALPFARPVRARKRSAEPVSAFFGNHVEPHAAGRRFGADAAGLIRHFLAHLIVEVALDCAVALQTVDHHPVHHHGVVRGRLAMCRHVRLLHPAGAGGIRQTQVHADNQLSQPLDRPAGRNFVHGVAVEDRHVRSVLHVHDRRRRGDRHRFLDRADSQLHIDDRGEVGGHFDLLAFQRLKPCEAESDGVQPRAQVDELVLSGRVGKYRSDLFDEDVARRFNGHAGQHRAGRVFDDAADRALRGRSRGNQCGAHQRCEQIAGESPTHPGPP